MEKALQTMIDNMPEKTGKSLEEWKVILSDFKFKKHGEAMKLLKGDYGVTHGFANTIIRLYKDDIEEKIDPIKEQYKGKEALYPIYESLIAFLNNLGSDVEIAPKKSSVSIRRKTQFTLIQPSTKTRIDLGLKLRNKPVGERLGTSGPFGSMCTHRVKLSAVEDIDDELKSWIKEAYDEAG